MSQPPLSIVILKYAHNKQGFLNTFYIKLAVCFVYALLIAIQERAHIVVPWGRRRKLGNNIIAMADSNTGTTVGE